MDLVHMQENINFITVEHMVEVVTNVQQFPLNRR